MENDMKDEPVESINARQPGIWVVLAGSHPQGVELAFPEEIDALRWVNHNGYGTAVFLPFGVNVHEVR